MGKIPRRNEGSDLDNRTTPNTTNDNSKATPDTPDSRCATNVVGSNDWDGEDHPYYAVAELIEEAQCMLAVRRKKAAINFLARIWQLIPLYWRHVHGAPKRL